MARWSAGPVFDVEHVAELLGLSGEEAVRRAETALRVGLLAEAGAGYEFANDVIRNVMYETTPGADAHACGTAAWRRCSPAGPRLAAEHAAAAGDREAAVDHWLDAAARSLAAFANREAEGLLSRALDACTLLGDPVRTARVQLLRGRARLAQARYDDAGEDLAAAQVLARAIGDLGLEAEALEALGWCAYYAAPDRAGRRAGRAGAAPSGLRPQAPAPCGAAAQHPGRPGRGDRNAPAGGRRAPPTRPSGPPPSATWDRRLAHGDRYPEAITVLDDAAASCRVTGLLRPMFNALFFAAMTRANLGDLSGALDVATGLVAEVERYGNDAYRPRARNMPIVAVAGARRPEAGARAGRRGARYQPPTRRLRRGRARRPRPAASRGVPHCWLGDEAAAARWLDELTAPGSRVSAFGWRVELHRLELESRLDPARAEELLDQAIEVRLGQVPGARPGPSRPTGGSGRRRLDDRVGPAAGPRRS